MKHKKKMSAIGILLIIMLCVMGILLWTNPRPKEPTAPAQTEPTFLKDIATSPSDDSSEPEPTHSTGATIATGALAPECLSSPSATVPPTEPTSATDPIDPTEDTASVIATEPTQPSAPVTKPTEPETQPAPLLPTEPSAPATQPSEPSAPATQPSEPATEPQDPRPRIVSPITGDYYIWLGEGSVALEYTYDGNKKDLTWYSKDPDVATVDQNGVVTPVSEGDALIVVYAGPEELSSTRGLCSVTVGNPEEKTTSFQFTASNPFYDGVTKYVGNETQFHFRMYCLKSDGTYNNRSDVDRLASIHTYPSKLTGMSPGRNFAIKSSNPAVVSVVNEFDCGWYYDYLRYKSAGTAVITITSWDGHSESYTIHVKDEYNCYPGKTNLTPGEFAYYATMVGVEDGLEASYQIRSYLYIWYSEEELTWEKAKSLGHANANREFYLNSRTTIIVYAGFDESNGKHLFFHGSGEPDGKLEPYTPAGNTTGKIRFPSSSINLMEKCLKVVEVLGDTRGEFVVYTSSDPNIVEASGSMLVAKHPGTATITATYKGQTATMTVNVTMDPTIERIIFEHSTYTIARNNSAKLKYTYNGTSELKWESSDESVARIDIMGTLVPVGIGQCTIRLRSVDSYFVVGYCTVIITEPIDYPDSTDIVFAATSDPIYDGMTVYVGDVLVIEAYTRPDESAKGVHADSSDYRCITVHYNWDWDKEHSINKLICLRAGTVTITIRSTDGCVSRSYTLIVKER